MYVLFIYDHFIKYKHSIENVTITPVEILSKQPGDSKNDKKKKTQTFDRTQLDKATTNAISSWPSWPDLPTREYIIRSLQH